MRRTTVKEIFDKDGNLVERVSTTEDDGQPLVAQPWVVPQPIIVPSPAPQPYEPWRSPAFPPVIIGNDPALNLNNISLVVQ